jgi:hypothetical protein
MPKDKKVKKNPPYAEIIRRHCVPLHIVEKDISSHNQGGVKFVGGSALLLETIAGRFFVTASHVWRELMDRAQRFHENCRIVTYELNGPVPLDKPILIDESEELDLAVFTVSGINNFNLNGKEFLQTSNRPMAAAQSDDIIVGCGYPGNSRLFIDGHWEFEILFWAHNRCSLSQTGTRLWLDGQSDKGKITYSTKAKSRQIALPGISGAPLFALRETLDWVGVVRSGCGTPLNGYSIQATPSSFVMADGHILKN